MAEAPVASIDPAVYHAWYETPRGAWIAGKELALLARLLRPRPGEALLDVGCGTGWFSSRFADLGLRVTGIDPDPAALAFARRRDGPAPWRAVPRPPYNGPVFNRTRRTAPAMSRRPAQPSLFDEDNDRGRSVVSVLQETRPADKAQAAFQRLVKQIETQRALLADWQAYRDRYTQRVLKELEPLREDLRRNRHRLVLLLDQQHERPGAIKGKRLRAKLQAMIVELVQGLLAEGSDPELVAIHDRHCEVSHAELDEMNMALTQSMLEGMLGVRLDGGQADSVEKLFAQAQQKLQNQERRKEERRSRRRQSARGEEARARRAEAQRQVTQSVKDVYRKLASALHPDRVGKDLSHERKTALMQRVNRAYEAGNLLDLLNIQLEIEQIDADHLTNLPGERLAHYTQVLREQLAEIKAEVNALVAPFRDFLPPGARNLDPAHVDVSLDGEIAHTRTVVRDIERDLDAFQDPAKLSAALKDYRPPSDADALDVLDDLAMMMGGFPQPPARRGRGKRGRG